MAKGKYGAWLEPENLVLLHGWKLQGLTDEQIADKIGIAHRTFERWKAEHSQIRQAIKGGKEVANFVIENELFKKAKSGNVTAMIFYLKNNYREKYTDDMTDPALREAQIQKARAEARIAEMQAQRVTETLDARPIIINSVPDNVEEDIEVNDDADNSYSNGE